MAINLTLYKMLKLFMYTMLIRLSVSDYVEFPVSPDFNIGWNIQGQTVQFTMNVI